MTPLELSILLHYYSRGNDFDGKENKPQTQFINFLVGQGILIEELTTKPIYKITDKGIAYVQGILEVASSVSMPVWAIPETTT